MNDKRTTIDILVDKIRRLDQERSDTKAALLDQTRRKYAWLIGREFVYEGARFYKPHKDKPRRVVDITYSIDVRKAKSGEEVVEFVVVLHNAVLTKSGEPQKWTRDVTRLTEDQIYDVFGRAPPNERAVCRIGDEL